MKTAFTSPCWIYIYGMSLRAFIFLAFTLWWGGGLGPVVICVVVKDSLRLIGVSRHVSLPLSIGTQCASSVLEVLREFRRTRSCFLGYWMRIFCIDTTVWMVGAEDIYKKQTKNAMISLQARMSKWMIDLKKEAEFESCESFFLFFFLFQQTKSWLFEAIFLEQCWVNLSSSINSAPAAWRARKPAITILFRQRRLLGNKKKLNANNINIFSDYTTCKTFFV